MYRLLVSSSLCLGMCVTSSSCRQSANEDTNTQATHHAAQMDSIREYIDKGDVSRAQVALSAAFENGFEHPMAYFLQGRITMAEGTQAAAAASIPWFEKAIAASPAWIEPRLLLAQACLRDQRLRRAEQLFTDIDMLIPHNATGPYGLGLIDSMDGLIPEAIIHLDESLKRNPKYGPALLLRAQLAGRQNQEALQRQLYERYISVDPLHPASHFALAELYQKNNRLDDAWRAFSRSYELYPNSDTARRLAEIANLRNDTVAQDFWQKRAGISETTSKKSEPK